jgi:hypothetical protein
LTDDLEGLMGNTSARRVALGLMDDREGLMGNTSVMRGHTQAIRQKKRVGAAWQLQIRAADDLGLLLGEVPKSFEQGTPGAPETLQRIGVTPGREQKTHCGRLQNRQFELKEQEQELEREAVH